MDRTQEQAANAVIAATVENGGATFEARTLLPATWSDGYMVARGGVQCPEGKLDAAQLVWLAKAAASEYDTTYAGTWVKDGIVYIDAVEYFAADRFKSAIDAGLYYGQEAIWDWAAGDSIYLPVASPEVDL